MRDGSRTMKGKEEGKRGKEKRSAVNTARFGIKMRDIVKVDQHLTEDEVEKALKN